MKLLRWAAAGASVYAMYKYSIGKKDKGEDVFVSPERAIAELEKDEKADAPSPKAKPAPKVTKAATPKK